MSVWTCYDATNPATWPPVSGEEVLVCYRVPVGAAHLTVTWANRDSSHDGWVPPEGAEWLDLDVQHSTEVMWRPLTLSDYPSDMPGSAVSLA